MNAQNKHVFSKHLYHGLYYNSLVRYVSLDHHVHVIEQGDTTHHIICGLDMFIITPSFTTKKPGNLQIYELETTSFDWLIT